jgi:hypothetical protein
MGSRAESVPPMHPRIASALPHTSGGAVIPTSNGSHIASFIFLKTKKHYSGRNNESLATTSRYA